MKALRYQFAGEVNTTKNVTKVKQIRNYIHYKNEGSMEFELFLTKFQKMYNIFEEEGDPMREETKIIFLFKRVEHSDLQKSIKALRYQMSNNPSGKLSYTTASNHLRTAVSKLP